MDQILQSSEKSTSLLLKVSRKNLMLASATATIFQIMLKFCMKLASTKVSDKFLKNTPLIIDAEKILFSLKEILVNESSLNIDLML